MTKFVHIDDRTDQGLWLNVASIESVKQIGLDVVLVRTLSGKDLNIPGASVSDALRFLASNDRAVTLE